MEIKGRTNNYYVKEAIAEGGYGYVYLGMDQENKEVVIKSLQEYFGSHGHLFKKFNTPMHEEALRKEARILQEIQGSPSVPEFIDFIEGNAKQGSALIMEYIRGAEVKKRLKAFIQDPRKGKEYAQFLQKNRSSNNRRIT